MKIITLNLFFTLIFYGSYAQTSNCPPNIDFEAGSFANWQCFTGTTFDQGGQNFITLNPTPPTSNRHEIMSRVVGAPPVLDQYGAFPVVCPYGGRNSVRLGNNSSSNQAEGISYTFQIPVNADTFSLTYYYAVVFQDPNHPAEQQPRFFVSAYDVVTGALINCASYNYVSDGSIPGFLQSTSDPSVLYKDWTPVTIDFSGLSGRNVRLEFKTADCTLGGHFGYAYLDVGTGCGGLLGTAAYCVGTNVATLNAPYGFQSYIWYNANYTAVVGTTQVINLVPPPPVNTMYHVDMIPYPGYGCRDTADAILQPVQVPDTPAVTPNVYYCRNTQATPLTATGSPENILLWYTSATGGTGSITAPTPSTAALGTTDYYVTQKALFGCESVRSKITVHVLLTPTAAFTIANNRQCLKGNLFSFTNGSADILANSQYFWDFGDGDTSKLPNPKHTYKNQGTYTVKLRTTNPPICSNEISKTVEVIGTPVAQFNAPALICESQVPVLLTDASSVPGGLSTVSGWWWRIDNNVYTTQNPAPFPANAGKVKVEMVVRTPEGCTSDTTRRQLTVHYAPLARITVQPKLCDNEIIQFKDSSVMPVGAAPDFINQWKWTFDNSITDAVKDPIGRFTAGPHQASLFVTSDVGCPSVPTIYNFFVNAKPLITLSLSDSCIRRSISFNGGYLPGSAVSQWYWGLDGGGLQPGGSSFSKTYASAGNHRITLIGRTTAGCKDTIIRPYTIYQNSGTAGNDTITAKNEPVQLKVYNTEPGMQFLWTPADGLNNVNIDTPIAVLDRDILYILNTITKEGCDAESDILVRRYKGPDLYIPNAFTPNGDGFNDYLKVFPVGVKVFVRFSVYNRFGTLLYHNTSYVNGWDGTYKGKPLDQGAYVVIAEAVDYLGNKMLKKGSVVLIR